MSSSFMWLACGLLVNICTRVHGKLYVRHR